MEDVVVNTMKGVGKAVHSVLSNAKSLWDDMKKK
jgi:hypothetical protein